MLKNDVWQLTSTISQTKEILSDISFLISQISDNDTLESLYVADIFCMVESK